MKADNKTERIPRGRVYPVRRRKRGANVCDVTMDQLQRDIARGFHYFWSRRGDVLRRGEFSP